MIAHRGKFVAYFRVSTDRQGKSGLGLDAQREAVMTYLNGGSWTLAAEYVEIESGKHNERPQLLAALAACKKLRARLSLPSSTAYPATWRSLPHSCKQEGIAKRTLDRAKRDLGIKSRTLP